MVVRIVAESFLEGDVLPVYRLVEQLSGQVSEVYAQRVGRRCQFLHKTDKWRLGVCLETSGYGGDIDEVIRFYDDELGHVYFAPFVASYPHQVELGSHPQYLLEVTPRELAFTCQNLVVLAVAYLPCRVVLLLRSPYIVVVPPFHHYAHGALVKLSPRFFSVGCREVALQTLGYLLLAAQPVYQQGHGLEVVWKEFLHILGSKRTLSVVFGKEVFARQVQEVGHAERDVELLDAVVQFGEEPHEGYLAVEHALVYHPPAHTAQDGVAGGDICRSGARFLQLGIKGRCIVHDN